MSNPTFGTTRFCGPVADCTFASLAPLALGACAVLRRAPRHGLTAREVADALNVPERRRPTFGSGVLQKLLSIRVLRHPADGSTHRYILARWPQILPA